MCTEPERKNLALSPGGTPGRRAGSGRWSEGAAHLPVLSSVGLRGRVDTVAAMDWPRLLRDFALFGACAAAALCALRWGPGARMMRRASDAVGSWSPHRALLIVLVLTAGAGAATLPLFVPPFNTDVREYVEKAEAIAAEGTPRRQEVRPGGKHFYRPLGSSLALAGWYRLTGTRGLTSARVHGIALACLAAWLILVLGRTIGRDAEGRLAALGYAVYLPHVFFATIPYTETFVTALVLAASVLFERLRRGRGGLLDAAALGLAGGWIGITRTELGYLLPLAALLLVVSRRRAALVPAALAAALFVVPFAVNHELRAGYPGHLRTSVQGGLILYFGNNPIEVNGYGNATPAVVASAREKYAQDPTGGTCRDAALAWMSAHPFEAAANFPKKVFHLWLAEPQGFRWRAAAGEPTAGINARLAAVLRSAAYVQSLLVLAAGLLGLALLGPERRFWMWALALHLGIWCLLASSTRNRYPLEPWPLIAAAAWLVPRRGDGPQRSGPHTASPRRSG